MKQITLIFLLFQFQVFEINAQKKSMEVIFPFPICEITELTDTIIFELDEESYLILKLKNAKYQSGYLVEKGKIYENIQLIEKNETFKSIEYFIEGEKCKVEYYISFDGALESIYSVKKAWDDFNQDYRNLFDGWTYFFEKNDLVKIHHRKAHKNDGLEIAFDKNCKIRFIVDWYQNDKYKVILGKVKPSFWYRLFH